MRKILNISALCLTLPLMLAVGMEHEGRHLRDLAASRRALCLCLVAQTVFLPILGYPLSHLLSLPTHLSAGMLLSAACPVGDIANFIATPPQTNIVFAVALNVLSCLPSAITMMIVVVAYNYLLPRRLLSIDTDSAEIKWGGWTIQAIK